MKSNLYSILIFLIGLFITFHITKNFHQAELNEQQDEIKKQSQAIGYTVQQQIFNHMQQISLIAQQWNSIQQINAQWEDDKNTLKYLLPHLSHFNIYLLAPQPELTINTKEQHYFESNSAIARKSKHFLALDKKLHERRKGVMFLSQHEILDNNEAVIYLQTPIFIGSTHIGYLDAMLNLTKLLDKQVKTFQITSPFSLSEKGRTIHTVLPRESMVSDVKQQFSIPLLTHNWKLMVWPAHQHNYYRYIPFIGLVISILLALLVYVVRNNKQFRKEILLQKTHLSNLNKDFSASKSKLIQSNKLSSLGEIATGIAHEINQPLQVICIHADMCQESLQNKDYRLVDKSFRAILLQVERIEKIVKQVGSFGRDSGSDNFNKEIPSSIFDNVINIVINQYNQENVELRQVLPPSLPSILCNKTQIEQVLVNLLINAKDAVEESAEKVVFIKAHHKAQMLHIEVTDSGSGIEPSKLDDIFTPFYTTKALGKGTGLGLSISYSIIHQHKGELQVSSEIGKGSTFTVILPLS